MTWGLAKWILVGLYVLATIGVFAGVYLEGDKFPSPIQHTGWRVLLWSLGAEILFGVSVFAVDGWIAAIQRTEIVRLEARLAARHLSKAQASDIESQLNKFLGQKFEVIPYWQDKESLNVANEVADSLISAKWKIDQPKRFVSLVGVVAGISVSVDKGSPKSVHDAESELVNALNKNGVQASIGIENNNPIPTAKIYINVGIKP